MKYQLLGQVNAFEAIVTGRAFIKQFDALLINNLVRKAKPELLNYYQL